MEIVLAVLALLPAAALMFYIYKMDRIDKEPIGLLIGLFFLGVGCAIPAILLELLAHGALNLAFTGRFVQDDPYTYPSMFHLYLYQFIKNFFCIALIEEALKWIFMFLITRKNKNFNCLFDGVVYAVFVSLGFAAAENLLYVFQLGIGNALLRMVTAVPAHCFFAVFMGYYYSFWFLNRKAGALEKHLRDRQIIPAGEPSFKSGVLLFLSLAVPTAAHGLYDFAATIGSVLMLVVFFLFLGFMYFICFRNVYKLSKKDQYTSYLSMDLVLKKYPQAAPYVSTMPEYAHYFNRNHPQPAQPPVPPQGYQQPPQGYQQPSQDYQQPPQDSWQQP